MVGRQGDGSLLPRVALLGTVDAPQALDGWREDDAGLAVRCSVPPHALPAPLRAHAAPRTGLGRFLARSG